MNNTFKLFVLAGEPSGDRIAADLVKRLRAKVNVDVSGVGGDELIGQGLRPPFPMSDLAVMGLTDVLLRLPLLLWRIEQTARAIMATQPDIVVLVDAQDFSKRLAKRIKTLGFGKPILLYVAPTVWARAPHRAKALKPLFDEVLAVLPFEPAVMTRLEGPLTSYVGHPALDEGLAICATSARGLVALLPGSRNGELRRHLPVLGQVAGQLADHSAVDGFFIPTLPSLESRLRAETANWPVPVTIVADRTARHALYAQSIIALSVSGTATLELALARLPMVVIYVLDTPQAREFERIGRPQVGLPNIILARPVTEELITVRPEPDLLVAAARRLLDNEKARHNQIVAFDELVALMEQGAPDAPRQDPADRVLGHWPVSDR
ncbi:lipid-A-disaccharide synthase [uncultured Devosia sp.]|uniref:lipid-A-disaccharide synthase n=1 Tax=uncultured Devosia sp. TaxID=211434 RepID=UPI0035CBEB6A